jgi:hypothetical protein
MLNPGVDVVVRSSGSGVWFGFLVAVDGDRVLLKDAIKIWEWEGAAATSGLAVRGPKKGKLCEPVICAMVTGVCEILCATEEASKAIKEMPKWRA